MFDVGFAEILLLALIGLLVLGPERLPGVARTVGGIVRKARTSWDSLRSTMEAELAEADIAAPIKETSEELKKISKDLSESSVFKPEKYDFDSAESKPVTGDEPKPDPLKEPDSEKSEDV